MDITITATATKQNKNTEGGKGERRRQVADAWTHREGKKDRGVETIIWEGGRVRTTHPALIKPERSC